MLLLAAEAGEFAHQLLLPRRELGRRLDEELDHQVAAFARAQRRHPTAFQPHSSAGLGTLTSILHSPSQFSPPSRQGISIAPPSAAVPIGTGAEQSRSSPSRSNSSC